MGTFFSSSLPVLFLKLLHLLEVLAEEVKGQGESLVYSCLVLICVPSRRSAELNCFCMICRCKRVTVCFQTVLSDEFQPGAALPVVRFFKDFGDFLASVLVCFVVVVNVVVCFI